jgi:hypothetical protein
MRSADRWVRPKPKCCSRALIGCTRVNLQSVVGYISQIPLWNLGHILGVSPPPRLLDQVNLKSGQGIGPVNRYNAYQAKMV